MFSSKSSVLLQRRQSTIMLLFCLTHGPYSFIDDMPMRDGRAHLVYLTSQLSLINLV
jgi:hypothetical protein